MNLAILYKEVQDFINANLDADIHKLLFKGSPFDDISIQELVEQIDAKQRCKRKLPSWFNQPNIYYPNKLNIAQTSSEISANFKANLISGDLLIDLTGGFGVDSKAFTTRFNSIVHCEINTKLASVVRHNFNELQLHSIEVKSTDGLAYLKNNDQQFDWIYLDPSRRSDSKEKVFLLKDCLPDVTNQYDMLFSRSKNIMLKVSPLLDISQTISDLKFVKKVYVIAIQNEVKELLFILEKEYGGPIEIHAANLKSGQETSFSSTIGNTEKSSISEPKKHLYEPNSAILKAGLFNQVSSQLNIDKLHTHSHLYTSDKLIEFPGRSFLILSLLPYDVKQLKKEIPNQKANITTRNFPETVAQIRKKTKLKDGGDLYLFFTTNLHNKHIVLICKKV